MKKHLKMLMAALLCLLLCGCSLLPVEEERKTAPLLRETQGEDFELSYVMRGDLEKSKKISCTYVPIQEENVKFGVSGEFVDEIFVQVGDMVKKGDLLGQLKMDGVEDSISDLNFNIAKVKLNIEHLEEDRALQLERQELLYATDPERLSEAIEAINVSYDKSLQSYNDSLYIMQLQLQSLQEEKRLRQLIAPIDGTVTYARKYVEGALSDETERAVTVADATMSLFSSNTDHWDMFTPGDLVVITAQKVEYEAVVADEKSLGLEETEHLLGERGLVYFTLLTPALELEDGDRGTLTLILDSREDVLLVHQDAITEANGETICYVRDKDGMKTYKKVKLGLMANRYYEVIEGLEEGEEVIVG